MGEAMESMLAGLPYRADDPELKQARRACQRALAEFNSMPETPLAESPLAGLLASVGADSYIEPPFRCDYGTTISVGTDSFLNYGAVVLDVCAVRIGDGVRIGPSVQLLTAEHPVDPELRREGLESGRPIEVGDNVWIGAGAIVCAGVTIGRDSVIGAGSVVLENVPPRTLAVGSPCRPVREL